MASPRKTSAERSLHSVPCPPSTPTILGGAGIDLRGQDPFCLAQVVTQQRLDAVVANLVTQQQLDAAIEPLATKEELRAAIEPLATKEELAQLELRMTVRMEELTGKMLKYMGGGLALAVALIKGLDLLAG